jgi:hypothetical protein
MRTKEDIEQYMNEMNLEYEELNEGVFHIFDDLEEINDIYVLFTPPIVTFIVRLMDIPANNKEEFYHLLLELNGQLIAGAYSIEGNSVFISDTLQTENLDFNEFQASVESLATALVEDYPRLIAFQK